MLYQPSMLAELIFQINKIINDNADEITQLDQVIGDGDHLVNLQRGLKALDDNADEWSKLKWDVIFQKIGMSLLSTMGGASGSLFGTLFLNIAKGLKDIKSIDVNDFSHAFNLGVESVKNRGKSDLGEKTMLDVLIPVALCLKQGVENKTKLVELFTNIDHAAIEGMESTKDMLATKGRSSFLKEKSLGHIDAGARTSQLIICCIVAYGLKQK